MPLFMYWSLIATPFFLGGTVPQAVACTASAAPTCAKSSRSILDVMRSDTDEVILGSHLEIDLKILAICKVGIVVLVSVATNTF